MANQLSFELDTSAEKQYWNERLEVGAETASFRAVFLDGGNTEAGREKHEIVLPPTLEEALEKLTNGSAVLCYTVFLSVLSVCLYKYSGIRLVSVGHPALKLTDENPAAGNSLLVFQSVLRQSDSFKELLKQTHTFLKADYAHPNYDLEQVGRDLALGAGIDPLRLISCFIASDEIHSNYAQQPVPLEIRIERKVNRRELSFEFDRAVLDLPAVEGIAEHFLNILRQALENPEIRISEFVLPTPAERQRLLVDYNDRAKSFWGEIPVHRLFEAKVAELREMPAISLAGFSMTYGELDDRANQLAHYLIGAGVKPETNVGIALERSLETVISVLGVLKAGAVFLPVDMQNPPERLGYILQDCGVEMILTKKPYRELLKSAVPDVKMICLDEESDLLDAESTQNPGIEVFPNQAAYTIYTSGSTGFPKGVVVEHVGLLNYVRWCLAEYPLDNPLTMLHSPLSFDLTITSIFPPLLAGKTIEIIPELPSVEGLAQSLLSENRYNLLKITPSHLQLLSAALKNIPARLNLNCLVIGGEALKNEAISFWLEKYPEIRCFNEYGPTETVVGCSVYEITGPVAGNIPIGKPVYNQKLYVLDEFLHPVPVGVTGEIYISGKALARGYRQKFELTAEKFVPNPFSEHGGERMYRTGDLGRFNAELNLEYLGRADNQVKIRGFRIELSEIEFNLSLYPDVLESVVAVREDNLGQKRIVAYLMLEERQPTPGLKEVRQALRQSLPEYMLPSAIVRLESLPLTNNGKVDTNALPEPDWAALSTGTKGAANLTEDLLINIWSEILGVSDISIDDNFFELGGHSLLATRVVARIREVWNTEVEIGRFFEKPTIRAIAGWLDDNLRLGESGPRPPILRRVPGDAESPASLSFSQNRLWFLEQLNPGSPLYNVQLAIRLRGRFDVLALENSLNRIVERHEILRTSFVKKGNEPVQIVNPHRDDFEIPVIEFLNREESERLEKIRETLTSELLKGFDLTRGKLLRAVLIKTEETEHVAVLTLHHIVFDGWSTAILVREIGELYRAFTTNTRPNLPNLEIQYADFADWQRKWLEGDVLEEQLGYWRRQLAGIPAFLDLPTDRPRPLVQSVAGDVVTMKFDETMVNGLKKISRNESATMFMTLMAGFRALLYKYTGQNDILIGTPVAGRVSKELENLIGIFINNLVLRGFVDDGTIFSDLIRKERETALAAYSHQDVSWEKIVEDLNPDRNLGHPPIFQVMLTLQNMAIGTLELGDITMSNVEIPAVGARYDLVVRLVEVSGQMTCSIEYNSDLFKRDTAERFLRHYRKLLSEAADNANSRIYDLVLIEDAEREQILNEWNDTGVDFGWGLLMPELISQKAFEVGNRVAVGDGDREMSYAELETISNRIAERLNKHLGGRGETVVGICLDRSCWTIAAILGVMKAGAAYLPLDPSYPQERLGYMVSDSRASLIVTQTEFAENFGETGCETILYKNLSVETDEPRAAGRGMIGGEDLAYLIYTSGSTGRPKGTMVSHRNLRHSTLARLLYYRTAPEVYLLLSSFSFDSSVAGIFWTLGTGGKLFIPPAGFEKMPEKIGTMIEQQGVTTLLCLPSVYDLILSNVNPKLLSSLRVVIVAGEAFSNGLIRKHHQLLPTTELHNEYGPTEASVWSTAVELTADVIDENISIGWPIPNSTMYVLDEKMRLQPPGVPGGLFIGGEGITRGYFNRPDLTAERFLPDPFGPAGARLYRTGDFGRFLNDGRLEYRGREDRQIKIRGYRIELGEIESAMNQIEGVDECVVGVFGNSADDKLLVGYYVCRNGQTQLNQTIRQHLKTKLPEFMIPQIIQKIGQIPRLPNGKINRQGLPKPEVKREDFNEAFVPPISRTETKIAEIWAKVLQIDRVGLYDNFFDLGGHSFMIIKVHDQIRKHFSVDLPLISLFEYTTVATLAVHLGAQGKKPEKEISYQNWADKRKKAMRPRQRV